jgi:hypothetical protein
MCRTFLIFKSADGGLSPPPALLSLGVWTIRLFANEVRDYVRHGRVEANHVQHAAVVRVGEGEAVEVIPTTTAFASPTNSRQFEGSSTTSCQSGMIFEQPFREEGFGFEAVKNHEAVERFGNLPGAGSSEIWIASKSAPASSGFRLKNSSAFSTASAKRVAKAIASTGSRSVSNKYQRNCRSTSVSKRSERWTVTCGFVESDPKASEGHLSGEGCDGYFDLPVSKRRAREYLSPSPACAARRTSGARHHERLRWHYCRVRS